MRRRGSRLPGDSSSALADQPKARAFLDSVLDQGDLGGREHGDSVPVGFLVPVAAFGFSNGCAAFALKKPPPFVPSILMATWLATGPNAIVCSPPSTVVAV